jgi:hypothetical protein
LESQRRADVPGSADENPILNELSVRPIEEPADGMVRKGLELNLKGDRITSGSGKVTMATGLPRPEQLELHFTWGVTGTLRVDPDNLSFDPGRPEGHERILRVQSRKPGFRLLRVRVLAGPFAAALERPESSAVFKVKVTWNGPLPGEHARPETGKLQLISNDPAEPKKEVPLRIITPPWPPQPPPQRAPL